MILSDISMPGMDGFELLRRLRRLPDCKEVPVLALTGFGRVEDVERAKAEGFFSHVTKPVDVGGIVEILQKLPATGWILICRVSLLLPIRIGLLRDGRPYNSFNRSAGILPRFPTACHRKRIRVTHLL